MIHHPPFSTCSGPQETDLDGQSQILGDFGQWGTTAENEREGEEGLVSRAGFLRGNPHPQHLRMTVFGDRNFKEVIKHNWGSLGGALTQSNGYLDKKRMCGCRETPGARMCPRREDHMRTQQEAGRPQAKERDGPRRRLYQHHIVTKIPFPFISSCVLALCPFGQ